MLIAHIHMIITALVLIAVFILFVKERIAPHLTAMGAMAVLLACGVITTENALSTFSNPAPITIAAMFVLSAALSQTGVIDLMGYHMLKTAENSRTRSFLLLLGGVMLASAFMNNTPVVLIMAPVVIAVAQKLKESPSKHLIPLSYAAILGGSCTLIGTSTNLLVDGVAQANGQPAFSLFEITLPGIIIAATGGIFLLLFSKRLLPDRPLLEQELINKTLQRRFIAEAMIPTASPLIGKTLHELQFSEKEQYEIIDLVRHDMGARNSGAAGFMERMRQMFNDSVYRSDNKPISTLRDIPLMAGDRLIFKTDKNELLEIKQQLGLTFDTEDMHLPHPTSARESFVIEGVIDSGSPFIGHSPAGLRLRRRYGSYILAIHRDEQNITSGFESLILKSGDILLLEGPKEELEKLFETEKLLSLTQIRRRNFDRKRAPLAIGILLAVVLLAAVDVMPIAGLAIIGAVVALFAGCVSQQRAYEAIDWRILMLIFGMLSLSSAMEQTGLARVIVEALAGWVAHLGPVAVLAILYLVTSLLTEVMSNNAAAVLLTPIAIGLAQSLGIDPRPFIVAVMFGASASFATPIGYQTNTYVYRAGNYRFKDFLRIGVPMNLLIMAATVIVVPLFWEM
jgi:di/tricarboxylate transporter